MGEWNSWWFLASVWKYRKSKSIFIMQSTNQNCLPKFKHTFLFFFIPVCRGTFLSNQYSCLNWFWNCCWWSGGLWSIWEEEKVRCLHRDAKVRLRSNITNHIIFHFLKRHSNAGKYKSGRCLSHVFFLWKNGYHAYIGALNVRLQLFRSQ